MSYMTRDNRSRETLPSNDSLSSSIQTTLSSPNSAGCAASIVGGGGFSFPNGSIISRNGGGLSSNNRSLAITTTTLKGSSVLKKCPISQLPYDLLLAIFSLLTEMCGSITPMATLTLVCRHWNRVCNEPFLWEQLAKKFFVAFPLVHALTGVSSHHRYHQQQQLFGGRVGGGSRNFSNASFGTGTTMSGGPSHHDRTLSGQSRGREGNSPLDAYYLGGGSSPLLAATSSSNNGGGASAFLRGSIQPSCPPQQQQQQLLGSSRHPRTASSTSSVSPEKTTTSPTTTSSSGTAFSSPGKQEFEGSFFGDVLSRVGLRNRKPEAAVSSNIGSKKKKTVRNSNSNSKSGGGGRSGFTTMPTNLRPRGPRTNKRAFLTRLSDVENIDSQRRYQILVNKRRGPVLHAFVNGILFCLCMCVLVGMLALENVEPTSAINAEVAFGFFWCTYLFVFAAVVTNCVMAAHFEPHPLVPRVKRHLKLILLSTAALVGTLFSVALPMVLVQKNIFQLIGAIQRGTHPEESPMRSDWLKAAAPVMIAMLTWQAEVFYSTRHNLQVWLHSGDSWFQRGRGLLRWSSIYHVGAHCTPLFFVFSLISAVEATMNPGSTLHLFIGTFPLLISTFVLSLVFAMEFAGRRRLIDGVAAVSLAVSCLFPIVVTFRPLRGFTLLPILVALTGFYFAHLNEMRRRMMLFEEGEGDDEDGAGGVEDLYGE